MIQHYDDTPGHHILWKCFGHPPYGGWRCPVAEACKHFKAPNETILTFANVRYPHEPYGDHGCAAFLKVGIDETLNEDYKTKGTVFKKKVGRPRKVKDDFDE